MTYQWSLNGVNLTGQTNRFLLVPNAQSSNSGSYELVASNQFGITTNEVLTINVLANPGYYSTVGAWGSDLETECDVPSSIYNPVSVAAGAYHNLALQGDGTVVAWGKNWFGQTNVPAGATNVIAVAPAVITVWH